MFTHTFEPSGHDTLANELYAFLKQAILQGDLEPGARLVEQTIAEATSVSRTPVRDALRQLEAAGFVKSDGRGLAVAALTSEELREAWVVMETLQSLSAKLAAVHRSEVDLLEMKHLVIDRGRAATADEDVAALVEINRRFHSAVHRASRNGFLADTVAPLILRIETMQDFTSARRRAHAQLEHEAILDAIRDHDPIAAERAMTQHLQNQLAETITTYGELIQ